LRDGSDMGRDRRDLESDREEGKVSIGPFNKGDTKASLLDSETDTDRPSPLQLTFWFLLLWEPLIGLAVALAFSAIITTALKRFVGAPRPIYLALDAWTSIYPIERERYIAFKHESFPSGHASTAAAGLGFLSVVLLTDVRQIRKKIRSYCYSRILRGRVGGGITNQSNLNRSNLILLMVIYILFVILSGSLIFWIGATRITDYRHFAADVVAGWFVGAFAIFVSISLSPDLRNGTGTDVRDSSLIPATQLVYAALI